MAMPKKGTRKIVVDKVEYKYRTRKGVRIGPEDNLTSLTVEFPDGKYRVASFKGAVTPKVVEVFIRKQPVAS